LIARKRFFINNNKNLFPISTHPFPSLSTGIQVDLRFLSLPGPTELLLKNPLSPKPHLECSCEQRACPVPYAVAGHPLFFSAPPLKILPLFPLPLSEALHSDVEFMKPQRLFTPQQHPNTTLHVLSGPVRANQQSLRFFFFAFSFFSRPPVALVCTTQYITREHGTKRVSPGEPGLRPPFSTPASITKVAVPLLPPRCGCMRPRVS